jgi:glycosyltransferase involved in cell wall biosynthesis
MMKVLQIAYYYPPMGGAGVQRALKFSKYLGAFGITPVVLAAHDPAYVNDVSLAAEVPAGVTVHRVEHRPLLQRLMALRSRWAAVAPEAAAVHPAVAAKPTPARAWVRDTVLATYAALRFPDDKSDWARAALRDARALIREHDIRLIFSSAPPVSGHWLAARLARETGLPWVADYRDLWTENPAYAAPGWRRALDWRSESAWLRDAAGVVAVTPSWREGFARRLGVTCPVAFIPNGYDEADFAGLAALERDPSVFRLVHTGTFYGPRDPGVVLDAIERYLRDPLPGARPLRLRLIGNMGSRFDARLAAFAAMHPGVVEAVAYLPHREALAEMMAADALLLVVGAGRGTRHGAVVAGTLPGKVFEYLRSGLPVLLLGDENGDAAGIVRRNAPHWVADETDPARIATALRAMLGAAGPTPPTEGQVAQYERRELTRQLAEFMRACQERHRGR